LFLFALFLFFHWSTAKPKWNELRDYSFDQYLNDFHKAYAPEEYLVRKSNFEKNIVEINEHNANPTYTWKLGVNKLTDWTKDEFKNLLGYKRKQTSPKKPISSTYELFLNKALPTSVDWRTKNIITDVKDQGSCGSCWTFGTTETIESFWAMKTTSLVVLSEQQILDCTPNPNDCGGTGGCGGGTPELAYAQLIQMGGLTSEQNYPYTATDGTCQFNDHSTPPVAKLSGYQVLPSNNYTAVVTAVANIGPMVINVDASSWFGYDSGVYSGCDQKSVDIDHVVQLVGYGVDPSLGSYWLIRNSWGSSWGEDGYIRLARNSKATCGTDNSPQDGTGCNGGPPSVTVCGECGILYDVSYPVVKP